MSLELSPEIETIVRERAEAEGVSINELLARTFTPDVQQTGTVQDPTLALFAQWAKEDAQQSPEAAAAEEQLWAEFEKGINETRQTQGMRQL